VGESLAKAADILGRRDHIVVEPKECNFVPDGFVFMDEGHAVLTQVGREGKCAAPPAADRVEQLRTSVG
jgi:hypothetical protein